MLIKVDVRRNVVHLVVEWRDGENEKQALKNNQG